jgi:methylglutaconyl-CoA hydratase
MPNPIADPLVEAVDSDAESRLVRIEATRSGAATLWLDRPERGNPLDSLAIAAVHEALETLRGAKGVRIVFIRGAGGRFNAGDDAEALQVSEVLNEDDHRADALALARMLKSIADLPSFTVALVEGPAVGAGAGIVAACDMAVATADAAFSLPEVRRGLVAAAVAPFLMEAVGPRAARSLLTLGRPIDAQRAVQIGLVGEVVADAVALEAVQAGLAAEIMACAPGAAAEAKALIRHLDGRRIDHGLLEDVARRQAHNRVGEEAKAGVTAALHGEPAPWSRI